MRWAGLGRKSFFLELRHLLIHVSLHEEGRGGKWVQFAGDGSPAQRGERGSGGGEERLRFLFLPFFCEITHIKTGGNGKGKGQSRGETLGHFG